MIKVIIIFHGDIVSFFREESYRIASIGIYFYDNVRKYILRYWNTQHPRFNQMLPYNLTIPFRYCDAIINLRVKITTINCMDELSSWRNWKIISYYYYIRWYDRDHEQNKNGVYCWQVLDCKQIDKKLSSIRTYLLLIKLFIEYPTFLFVEINLTVHASKWRWEWRSVIQSSIYPSFLSICRK